MEKIKRCERFQNNYIKLYNVQKIICMCQGKSNVWFFIVKHKNPPFFGISFCLNTF